MLTLYGIKNCDTVKKARRWLEENNVEYQFHDFRSDGLESKTVAQWLEVIGKDTLINRRSTTWKQLSDAERQQADGNDAAALLVAHPTLIKRPVLAAGKTLQVGFNPSQYASLF